MVKKILAILLCCTVFVGCTGSKETDTTTAVEETTDSTSHTVSEEQTVPESLIYVNGANTSSGDVSSWESAFILLQDALALAVAGDEIWVAEGTYYPTEDEDISAYFQMVDGVDIYGGFDGTETYRQERDWQNNETTLSGDIGEVGVQEDNVTKVVVAANSRIDGFTVTGGYFSQSMEGPGDMAIEDSQVPEGIMMMSQGGGMTAPGGTEGEEGAMPPGGMSGEEGMMPPEGMEGEEGMTPPEDMEGEEGITLPEDMEGEEGMTLPEDMEGEEGMTLPEDMEGEEGMTPPEGMMPSMEGQATTEAEAADSGEASAGHLTPDAVTDGDASSSSNGNGICIWGVAPTIANCRITENEGGKAAGVAIDAWSQAVFIDCVFDSNACTDGKGGAVYNDFGGTPYFENCLFINNYAQSGGAMGNDGVANPRISNCTFYNNEAAEVGGALYQGSGPYNDSAVIDSIIWENVCELDQANIYDWNECNTKIDYSIVEGGYIGQAVLDTDPLFVDADNGDFDLEDDSPALTASSDGDRIGYDASVITDRTEEDYAEIIDNLYAMVLSEESTEIDVTNPVDSADATNIGSVICVDEDATGAEDGSSWDNAFTSIQEGIDYAGAAYELKGTEVEVWVSEGTYVTGDERSDSIILRTGVDLYGGFDGTESDVDDRDYHSNETILSGEIGDKADATDNSYHVLIGADDAILRLFAI